jgi:holo-ACP synthase
MIEDIYREALRSLEQVLSGAELLPESSPAKKTGPEGYLRLSLPADEAKRRTCLLEDSHTLGRLWDLDVFTDPDHSISRSDIGFTDRLCYICDRPAHECSRSKRHSLVEITRHIEELYRRYSDKKHLNSV